MSEKGENSEMESFTTSKEWFEKFKRHHRMHNIKMNREATSAHTKATNNYHQVLKKGDSTVTYP